MIFKRRSSQVLCLIFVLAFWGAPVYAQSADPIGQVETFFSDIENLMITVATSAAVIGCIGFAIMQFGSSIPFLADWKQENPKAARSIMVGILTLIFVGGGGLAALLSF